jgi:hypothetical protein
MNLPKSNNGYIGIDNNSGAGACDKSIAINKGWKLEKPVYHMIEQVKK